MTDPSPAPETPDVAETVNFLRRFSDLMSNGYNAAYLHRAADLLETLTARVLAASDEDELWRYKYENLSHHADALETECEALKNDIEGHLDIASSIMSERETLRAALKARDAEFSGLDVALSRERAEFAAKREAHEAAMAGLRAAFDREREALQATAAARGEELDRLRGERENLQAQLKVRGDELAALGVVSDREQAALRARISALEAKRAELRSAFDRIGDLRHQTNEPHDGEAFAARKPEAEASLIPAQPGDRDPAVAESDTVVPKATLRQARAQFEYLAKECIPRGDIASQVMCELAAYTMDLALVGSQQPGHLPVDEVAFGILARPGSAAPAIANKI
jgi:predicted  nucleic acid-binding Zn-ribbon protein